LNAPQQRRSDARRQNGSSNGATLVRLPLPVLLRQAAQNRNLRSARASCPGVAIPGSPRDSAAVGVRILREYALKSRAAYSGLNADAHVLDLHSTRSDWCRCVRIMSTLSRSWTVAMACIPLTARLMITCSWIATHREQAQLELELHYNSMPNRLLEERLSLRVVLCK